jgi:hypothetical protein
MGVRREFRHRKRKNQQQSRTVPRTLHTAGATHVRFSLRLLYRLVVRARGSKRLAIREDSAKRIGILPDTAAGGGDAGR